MPHRSFETFQANGPANRCVGGGDRLLTRPLPETFCARVDGQPGHDKHQYQSQAQNGPLYNAPKFSHGLEIGSDTEVNLPGSVAARRLEGKTNVQSEGSDGRRIAHSKTGGELQIIHRNIERPLRNLPEVEKDSSIQFFPDWTAQFKGPFDNTEPAQRVVIRAERTEAPTAVAAHALFTAGKESFE